ncbi:hypothetical protein IMCC14465_07160 [alpha proteobacterium IMCC14465]|uniref:GP-PDE domain-containing protein n=1 Tax=alpha proteobacterium IMCC14465 TaxID=1220535 RepID=J9A3I4_9PROT|nr:hypothetical protein IMCC14465_07160 [alpha proteobacterium IMCC14465]
MKTRIIAHRGGASLWPENTLLAFDQALRLECDGLELDLQLTKDDMLVVHHDADLRSDSTMRQGEWLPETSTPLRIEDLTYSELADFDVGIYRAGSNIHQKHPNRTNFQGLSIPKFSDVLHMAASYEKTPFMMAEIKTDGPDTSEKDCHHRTNIYAEQITHISPENIVTLCFDWRCLTHLAGLLPDTPLGFTTSPITCEGDAAKAISLIKRQIEQIAEEIAQSGSTSNRHAWNAWHGDITGETAAFAQQHGLAVYAWTVNKTDEMHRLVNLGIDSLMTDRPDIALKAGF